jgi:tryptophan 7-halogenase
LPDGERGVSAPIDEVVVAGGGITGWSAAAALRRRLPRLAVTVIASPAPPAALADRIGSTLPSILEFHRDIGLGDADAVLRAGSGLRLGTRFEGWTRGGDYVHAYGEYGRAVGAASFHHHWVRAARAGKAAAFDSHSAAAAIGRAGRFAPPETEPDSPLSAIAYGLHINPPRYREMMRAYALHLGATERRGEIAGVTLRGGDGFIENVHIAGGGEVAGRLFIDCTGPDAAIRAALDTRFEDWSRWLPADRILFAEAPPPADPAPLDQAIATTAGWRWEAASPVRRALGFVYGSAHRSEGEAEADFKAAFGIEPERPAVALRAGRRSRPWLRNCVAIGDAAVAVEPLEWTNLHLAHSAIDRIVSMMPDRDFAEVELDDYNRQSAAEADRVRDFLVLHYAVADRPDSAFWRDAAAAEPPASLAHSLALFRERGRLPFYEEETFSRDSWLAVLLGQGVIPRRTDPLIDLVPPAHSDSAMARIRESLAAIVPTLPNQVDYLRAMAKQGRR